MTWKEMLDGEDCELCPYMIEGMCSGGVNCFGGNPVYPPCGEYDIPNDKDLDELRKELSVSIQLLEQREQEQIKQKKCGRERGKVNNEKCETCMWKRECPLYAVGKCCGEN